MDDTINLINKETQPYHDLSFFQAENKRTPAQPLLVIGE